MRDVRRTRDWVLYYDGSHKAGIWRKRFQAPATALARYLANAKDLRREMVSKGDVELIEWIVEAFAKRFDEGFLASPAI